MRRSIGVLVALATLTALVPADLNAAALDGDAVTIGTYRQLRSEVLDEDRTLLVRLPTGYDDTSLDYPVLFLLYADYVEQYFVDAVHVVHTLAGEGSIPELIIVGIANVDRYRDLSPVESRGRPSGIEPFTRFFAEELVPFIETEYRTKDFRVLVGPQAGASFGVHALVTDPGLFDALVIENPFRNDEIHELLTAQTDRILESGLESPTFVWITCSDSEGFRDAADRVEHVRGFEALVAERAPRYLELVVEYIEENQDFIPPLRLKDALRTLFRGYRLPDDGAELRLPDLLEHYDGLSSRLGMSVAVPERALAIASDRLVAAGSRDAAMDVLVHMLEVYPESADGHWRIANLYRELDRRDDAIRHYRKCLEIIPNMVPARQWLDRLEEQ